MEKDLGPILLLPLLLLLLLFLSLLLEFFYNLEWRLQAFLSFLQWRWWQWQWQWQNGTFEPRVLASLFLSG